jgi:hypothetical protein
MMTGNFYLDWAILSVSLANVILLAWLGLTVLLNAERRTWGVWLAGGGLLLGAGFFISHTVILGLGMEIAGYTLNLWWRTGWLPLVALPVCWYIMVLWHAGFWDGHDGIWQTVQAGQRRAHAKANAGRLRTWVITALWYAGIGDQGQADKAARHHLRRLHGLGLNLALALLSLLAGLLLFAGSLPTFTEAAQLKFNTWPTLGGFPLLLLLFPIYILRLGHTQSPATLPGWSPAVLRCGYRLVRSGDRWADLRRGRSGRPGHYRLRSVYR